MEVVSVQVPTVVEPTLRLTDSVPAVPLALTTMVLLPVPELEDELLLEEELELEELLEEELELDEELELEELPHQPLPHHVVPLLDELELDEELELEEDELLEELLEPDRLPKSM